MVKNALGELRRYIDNHYFKFSQQQAAHELSRLAGRPISLGLIQGIENDKNRLQPYQADAMMQYLLEKSLIDASQVAACRRDMLADVSVLRYLIDYEDIQRRMGLQAPPIQPAILLKRAEDVGEWLARYTVVRCIGREAVIDEIFHNFERKKSRVMINDFGGTGKSTVAAQVAKQYLERNPDQTVLWLDVGDGNQRQVSDALIAVLKQYGIVEQKDPKFFDLLTSNRVGLVVLDNIWRESVGEFIASLPTRIAVLVTARERISLNVQSEVELPTLSESESLQIVLDSLTRAVTIEETEMRDLCRKLNHHPLALRIASAVISMGGVTAGEIAANLNEYVIHNDYANERRLSAIIEQSFQARSLSEKDRENIRLVFRLQGALFAPTATTELLQSTMTAYGVSARLEWYLHQLHRLNLITFDGKRQMYHMHDLVYAYAASQADMQQREAAIRACIGHVKRYTAQPSGFSTLDVVKDNILGAAVSSLTLQTDAGKQAAIDLMLTLGTSDYFESKGYPSVAIDLLIACAQYARRTHQYRAAHYLYIKARNGLTNYRRDHECAVQMAYRAAACARWMVDTHPTEARTRHASSLSVAAINWVDAEQLDKASAMLERAEVIARQPFDPEALSQIYEHRGYYYGAGHGLITEAVDALRKALSYAEQIRDVKVKALRYFFVYLNLGQAARIAEDFRGALEVYEKAAALAQQAHNDDWDARVARETGELYVEMHLPEEASRHLCKALDIYTRLKSPRAVDLSSYIKSHTINCERLIP